MTRNDLDAIQARADAATPDTWVYFDDTMNSDGTIQTANVLPVGILGANPWQVAACSGGPVEPQDGDDTRGRQASLDALFIAHSRQDVPSLVAEIRELRVGRAHVDNPVQNEPIYDDLIASAAVDNATRTDDPTDDAGHEHPACDIGPCSRGWDHDGPCA